MSINSDFIVEGSQNPECKLIRPPVVRGLIEGRTGGRGGMFYADSAESSQGLGSRILGLNFFFIKEFKG